MALIAAILMLQLHGLAQDTVAAESFDCLVIDPGSGPLTGIGA
jgi:hypothetical protein